VCRRSWNRSRGVEVSPARWAFLPQRQMKDGFSSWCRDCYDEAVHQSRARKRERELEAERARREAHWAETKRWHDEWKARIARGEAA
jgi:hypothetical protein